MKPKPGIYYNIPFSEYQEWEAINNSVLSKLAEKSPAHAKVMMDAEWQDTPAFSFGRAFHTAALEPDLFENRYIVPPDIDKRTKDGKARWAKFQEAAEGKEILAAESFELIQAMSASVRNSPAAKCITGGKAEVCIVWIDEPTGFLCKARLDYVHEVYGFLVDLKTAKDASPDGFAKAMFNYRYHQQLAFYMAGYKAVTGDDSSFIFVAVEKDAPYATAIYEVNERSVQAGCNACRKALDTFSECVKKDEWPTYQNEVQLIDMPAWALSREGVAA
jgi:hypothetical protein